MPRKIDNRDLQLVLSSPATDPLLASRPAADDSSDYELPSVKRGNAVHSTHENSGWPKRNCKDYSPPTLRRATLFIAAGLEVKQAEDFVLCQANT
ncbi:MAG: hypothetical protein ABI614_24895, partial [Planctomycetota bacterium]